MASRNYLGKGNPLPAGYAARQGEPAYAQVPEMTVLVGLRASPRR